MSRVLPGGGGYRLPKPPRMVGPGGGGYRLPPPAGMVGPGGGGYRLPTPAPAKHAKHATHAKKAHHAKKAKRGLARSASEVACCAAEALAASLRLAGGAVSDEDVLALYWHTASDADAGASIWETLDAAGRFGLAGVFGVSADRVRLDLERVSDVADFDRLLGMRDQHLGGVAEPGFDAAEADRVSQVWGHGLILGVDLPDGPHTVFDDGEAWWSWGEPLDPFPGAVIGEAWEVRWAA